MPVNLDCYFRAASFGRRSLRSSLPSKTSEEVVIGIKLSIRAVNNTYFVALCYVLLIVLTLYFKKFVFEIFICALQG